MSDKHKNNLQHKQKAAPEGLITKSIEEITKETEQKLGISNQEIEEKLKTSLENSKGTQQIEEQINQALSPQSPQSSVLTDLT